LHATEEDNSCSNKKYLDMPPVAQRSSSLYMPAISNKPDASSVRSFYRRC